MKKIIGMKGVALIICLASLLVACGQKGDLYLPEGTTLTSWIG